MSDTEQILVFGDDGSPEADVAWLWINNHRWDGWRIEAITGRSPEPGEHAPPRPRPWTPPWDRSPTAPADISSLSFLVATGDPRVVIADRGDAALIVVGSRGLGHLRAIWSGSTSEWLMHQPVAPVAVVRSARPVRSALICVDGSEHSSAAARALLRLPLSRGVDATVLAVDDGSVDAEAASGSIAGLCSDAGVPATEVQLEGRPSKAILDRLRDAPVDLVVLGTRGLTGLDRMKLGSTAAKVVRDAPCSALVVTADAEDEPAAR